MDSTYISHTQKNIKCGATNKYNFILLILFSTSALVYIQLNPYNFMQVMYQELSPIGIKPLPLKAVKQAGKNVCTDITQNRTYITLISHWGRLGNVLFTLTSLYGIAERNFMIPILVRQNGAAASHLFKVLQQINYNISVYENVCFSNCSQIKYKEKHGKTYDKNTENLTILLKNSTKNCNLVQLEGYFQSWKYFSPKNEVIKHITFKQEDILQSNKTVTMFKQASSYQRYLQKRKKELNCYDTHNMSLYQQTLRSILSHELECPRVKIIGIHIRRGDMLHPVQKASGYVVPDASYFYHAMDYFQSKVYPHSNLLFIVCTDSIEWSKNNIKRDNVVFSEGNNVAVDLYLLSICDGLIISISTFSFWAAYLSGGKVIFYKNWFVGNSVVSKMVKMEDHYLPNWIPLT